VSAEVFKLFGTIEVGRQKFARDMGAMEKRVGGFSAKLKTGFDKAQGAIERNAAAIRGAGMALTIAGAAIGGVLAKTVWSAASFEQEMRNVNVIMRESEEGFAETSARVLELSTQLPQSAKVLARALYNIGSSGFKGAEGLHVLEQAARAAVAGVTETDVAAKALTTVLNAYGLEASEAGRVSDVLFKTVERGVLTFPELAENLGQVISSAAAAGVPFEHVAAAFATMTKSGINAAEASTALNRAILTFLSPSEEFAQNVRDITGEEASAIIQTRGLGGAVEVLNQIAGENPAILADVGLEMRALKAAMSLARQEGKVFSADMDAMANSAGAAAAAFEEQSKAFAVQWDLMKSSLMAAAITIGSEMLPKLRPLVDLIGKVGTAVAKWVKEHPALASILLGVTTAAAGLAIVLGPFLILLPSLSAGIAIFVPAMHGFVAVMATTTIKVNLATVSLTRFGVAAKAAGTAIATSAKATSLANIAYGSLAVAAFAVARAAVQATNDVDQFNKELLILEDRAQKARLETQRLPEALRLTWWQAFGQSLGDIVGYEGEITRMRKDYMKLWAGEIEMAEERREKEELIAEAHKEGAAAAKKADKEAAEERKALYSEAAQSILSNWQSLLDGMREGQRLTTSEYVQQLKQMLALLDTMNAARRRAGETPLFTTERLAILQRMRTEQVGLVKEQEAAEKRLTDARKEWAAEELAERRRLYSYERSMIDLTFQHKMDLVHLVDAEDEEARAAIMREELDALRQRREENELDAQSRMDSLKRERELIKALAAEEEMPEEEARAALEEVFEQMKVAQIELRGEEEKLYEVRRAEHKKTLTEIEEQFSTLRDEVSETTDIIGSQVERALNTLESGLLRVISRVSLPADPRPAVAGAVGAAADGGGGREVNIYIEGRQVEVEPNVQAMLDAAAQALEREHVHGRG